MRPRSIAASSRISMIGTMIASSTSAWPRDQLALATQEATSMMHFRAARRGGTGTGTLSAAVHRPWQWLDITGQHFAADLSDRWYRPPGTSTRPCRTGGPHEPVPTVTTAEVSGLGGRAPNVRPGGRLLIACAEDAACAILVGAVACGSAPRLLPGRTRRWARSWAWRPLFASARLSGVRCSAKVPLDVFGM